MNPTIVETDAGRISGAREGTVAVFRGVPYATAPTGERRWQRPEAAMPWTGVRPATHFGAICPRISPHADALPVVRLTDDLLSGTGIKESEDCLYLNVWTPGCDHQKRPVMVWIHGGGYLSGAGSAPVYDGASLAEHGDVVVVTVNYRLGALGFLNVRDATAGELAGSGTEGLADQLAALDWVRRNIGAFGGDAACVTVFGESAGAMSIGALLASPAARGLFRRAILQSGAAHIGRSREQAASAAKEFLGRLGVQKMRDAKDIQPGPLLAAFASAGSAPLPAIDGDLLPKLPIDAIRSGSAKDVELLVGTTHHEWDLFSMFAPQLRDMSAEQLQAVVSGTVGVEWAEPLLQTLGGDPLARWNQFMTTRTFVEPARRLLAAQGQYARVFSYRFDWENESFRACHAQDVGFVFGTHAQGRGGEFFGSGSRADSFSHRVMEAWTSFARFGQPQTADVAAWPCYSEARRETVAFGADHSACISYPDETSAPVWSNVPDALLGSQ